jgi:hypothetical protein
VTLRTPDVIISLYPPLKLNDKDEELVAVLEMGTYSSQNSAGHNPSSLETTPSELAASTRALYHLIHLREPDFEDLRQMMAGQGKDSKNLATKPRRDQG